MTIALVQRPHSVVWLDTYNDKVCKELIVAYYILGIIAEFS